jgi:hypothetical protein
MLLTTAESIYVSSRINISVLGAMWNEKSKQNQVFGTKRISDTCQALVPTNRTIKYLGTRICISRQS